MAIIDIFLPGERASKARVRELWSAKRERKSVEVNTHKRSNLSLVTIPVSWPGCGGQGWLSGRITSVSMLMTIVRRCNWMDSNERESGRASTRQSSQLTYTTRQVSTYSFGIIPKVNEARIQHPLHGAMRREHLRPEHLTEPMIGGRHVSLEMSKRLVVARLCELANPVHPLLDDLGLLSRFCGAPPYWVLLELIVYPTDSERAGFIVDTAMVDGAGGVARSGVDLLEIFTFVHETGERAQDVVRST